MVVTTSWYLALAAALFSMGAVGLLTRRNPLIQFRHAIPCATGAIVPHQALQAVGRFVQSPGITLPLGLHKTLPHCSRLFLENANEFTHQQLITDTVSKSVRIKDLLIRFLPVALHLSRFALGNPLPRGGITHRSSSTPKALHHPVEFV